MKAVRNIMRVRAAATVILSRKHRVFLSVIMENAFTSAEHVRRLKGAYSRLPDQKRVADCLVQNVERRRDDSGNNK